MKTEGEEPTRSLARHYSAAASDGNKATDAREASMLLAVAEGYVNEEEDEDALKSAQDALAFFRSSGDHASAADAVSVIIQCYIRQARLDEAAQLAREELNSFKKAGQTNEEGKMMLALAEVSAQSPKQMDEALNSCQEALAMFRSSRNDKMEAQVWLVRSKILVKKMIKKDEALAKEAQQAADDALAIFQRIGDPKGEAAALHAAAEVKSSSGDLAEALELAQGAIDIYQDLNLRKLEAFELHYIAKWCLSAGKTMKAWNFAEESLSIIRQVDASKKKEADVIDTLARSLLAKGRTGRAVKAAQDGLTRFQEAGETRAEAALQRTLFSAYLANGNTEQATLTLDKALEACQDAGDRTMEQRLLCDAAEMSMETGNVIQAIESATSAMDIAFTDGNPDACTAALDIVVAAYLANGDPKLAADAADEAREKFSQKGQQKAEASACLVLSRARSAHEEFDLAAQAAKAAGEIAYQEDDEALEARALDQLALVYLDAKKFEKASRTADRARLLWQGLGEKSKEAAAAKDQAQAMVSQAYKKLSEGKGGSAVTAIIQAVSGVLANGVDVARQIDDKIVEAHLMCVWSQQHALVEDEYENSWQAASHAYELFSEAGEERNAAYAQFYMAQAAVLQEKWERAQKHANGAMKVFKKSKNAEGEAVGQALLDKIERSMPKPEPVFQTPQMMFPMMMQGKGKGKGMSPADQAAMQQQMMAMQMQQQEGQVARKREGGGSTLDLTNVTTEILIAKVKEVALAIIGEGDELDEDTPLMEAGLTSSTAVVLKDEISDEIPGVTLPPTMMFDYPTVGDIAEFIMEKLNK